MAESSEQGRSLISAGDRLFGAKQNYDQLNQEIATWFYPGRADFTQELTLGEEFADHLTDSTPVRMHRNLADAIGTMMRPAGQDWFKLSVFDEMLKDNVTAARHLEMMSRVTRNILYSKDSGYKRATKEADKDFAAFGCSVMSCTLNQRRDGLNYRTWHLRDCAWMENDFGKVDHLHRKIEMTARGMEKLFGYEKLPDAVKKDLEDKKFEKKHKVRHVALPKDLYDAQRRMPRGAEYVSAYISEDGVVLQEDPEFEFPYIVSRWDTKPNWEYATSPATIVALPDARLIERMSLTIIEASEKSTDPPLIATTEAINSPIDISSGAVTWVDAEYDERLGAPLRPLDLGKNVGVGDRLLEQRTLDMASTFFLDKLNLPQQGQKTAYEVSQLVQEYVRNALPLFEPMEDEVTGQQLDLTVAKALRFGAYGPIEDFPEELQGQDIRYEFFNPLREARERQVINKFGETAQILATAAQFDPSAVAQVNGTKMVRDTLMATGPADWLKSEEEAAQEQAQMQESQAVQQATQQVSEVAGAAQEGAGAAQALQQVLGQV